MALTTTQVNAAFVALLGRAAEGNANAWAVNSADTKTLASTILSVDGSFAKIDGKDIATIEQAKTNEDFVEALYQTVLGRPADTDAKSVWLNALASGVSREELMTQFVAAAKANNEDLSVFDTNNLTFLSEVYNKLLNRPVDDSGQATWLGLLNSGVSRAEVVAKIIDAISSNPASSDYAIFNAKMGVANAVTAAFAGPKAGLNAAQNEELNNKLVGIISSVTSSDVKATDEGIKAEIDQVVGSYEKVSSFNFKTITDKLEDYTLGAENPTNSQTFRGTINLQDPTKSTISNKATLKTSDFSDTLVVDVIPSTNKTAFDYTGNASQVKTFASQGIENLTINNSTAAIQNLDNTGISKNLKIAGSANVDVTVKENLQYLEINNGNSKAKATVKVNANLTEYKAQGVGIDDITVSGATTVVNKISTGAGEDKLLVSSGTVKDVDLGSGIDTLTVSGGSISGATINLGAGDDTITIVSGTGTSLEGATINGGNGTDKLVVSGDISTKGTFTLNSVEVLEASGAATVRYAQIKGQALTLTKSSTGSLKIDTAKETAIELTNLKAGTDNTTKLTALDLTNVGSGTSSGVTVTLNKDDGIAETITLDSTAIGDNAVTITGIANTKIEAEKDKLNISAINSATGITSASSTGLQFDKINFLNVSKAIDTADLAFSELSANSISQFASSGNSKAIVAFNYGEKSYIYVAQNSVGSTEKDITAGELKLIATVDNKIGDGDTVTAGVITFA